MPLWLADYSSPMRIIQAKVSDDTEYYALQNYDLVKDDKRILSWKLQQPNPNIMCFMSNDASFGNPDYVPKVLNTLKTLGFSWSSIQLDSRGLVIKLFQDGTWYAMYKTKLTGETPSAGVIEYLSKSHNCTITIDGDVLTVVRNTMPVFPLPKTSTYESRKSYDLTGPDLTCLKNWVAYPILHFNENINLLGYPIKINLSRIQHSLSHEVFAFEWLDKVPPNDLIKHVFCNTNYTIGKFSDTGPYEWSIGINKWGTEPVTYVLNDKKKCNCGFCNKLRVDKHYEPAVLY